MRSAIGAILFVACTSTTNGSSPAPSPPPSPCPDIVGNWKVIATRTDGDCDPAKFADTQYDMTMRKGDDAGGYIAVFPALGQCPGDFDTTTCKFVANCDVVVEGKRVGSAGVEWTFDGNTMRGSEISRVLPPLSVKACDANYADEGTKL